MVYADSILVKAKNYHQRSEINMRQGVPSFKSEEEKNIFFEYCPTGIVLMDKIGNIKSVNSRIKDILGFAADQHHKTIKSEYETIFHKKIISLFNRDSQYVKVVLKTRNTIFHIKKTIEKIDGTMVTILINMGPVLDRNGCLNGIISTIEDITDQKLHEEDREKLIKKFSHQSQELTELHTVLETLIVHRKKEIDELKEKIAFNLRSLVIPYMEKLSRSQLNNASRIYLDIALSNLNDIFSSYGSTLSSKKYRLTPRELEVADLVRQDKSNKEIAEILHLSVRSIESHRRWIRKKMGLQGKNINLRNFIRSIK
jgi:PAS domain S-box-containing protein